MDGTMVVTIKPPAGISPEEFVRKMKNEVFPAVAKGPTRVGEIDSWTLLQHAETFAGESAENAKYVWLINWDGLPNTPVLANQALEKLRALGAEVHETNYSIVDEFSRESAP